MEGSVMQMTAIIFGYLNLTREFNMVSIGIYDFACGSVWV
jgi:hypothetical protein